MKVERKIAANKIKTFEEQKLTVTVWDDRNRDTCYQNHFKNLRKIKRKIDNTSPFVASSYFFKKGKFQNEQRSKEVLAFANNAIINRLNGILRTKGKVDHSNIHAYKNSSKLQDKITKCRYQSTVNKENLKVFMNTKAKLEMSTLEMDYDWENKQRLNIYQKSVYSIVLNAVRCPEYDVELTNPPSPKEFKENPKVVLEFHREGQPLGKVVILLFLQNAPLVCSRFLKLCSNPKKSYQDCIVYKIISNIMMETGDVDNENSGCFNSCARFDPDNSIMTHNHKGSVSMIVDSNGAVNSRFSISFKPLQLLNENRVVFGRVIKGFNVLNSIDSQGTNFGVPQKTILISKSRVFL